MSFAQSFFGLVNKQSWGVLKYSGVDVWKLRVNIFERSSISTLEWQWNHFSWGEKDRDGDVKDQAWFCSEVAATNKLEFLKWAREAKHCEWDEKTINTAAEMGNLEMLKYCFSNDCPCDERASFLQAAVNGHLDCLRFLFDKVEPSRKTEKEAAVEAAGWGNTDILKYFVEERNISNEGKIICVGSAARYGRLDCLKYLVEEAKVPLNHWLSVGQARYHEHSECVNYLLEKGCPEPTDEEYAWVVEFKSEQQNRGG